MKQDIENIIKKNLPEKKRPLVLLVNRYQDVNEEFNECLSQINTSLIADEVLKIVVEEIYKKMDEYEYHKDEIHCTCLGALREFLKELTNSSTLEGEQSEHLSTNKENK